MASEPRVQRHQAEASEELRAVTIRLCEALRDNDVETIGNLYSDDPAAMIIGTDPDEWLLGHDAMTKILVRQHDEVHIAAFELETLQAWVEGPVGWMACRITLTLGTGAAVAMRMTGVAHLRGGQWRFVQMHASVATENAVSFGKEMTTSLEALARVLNAERPAITIDSAPDGTVVVVFTDIEGSTTMNERMGDHQWLELLEWHDRALRAQADLNHGVVVKSQGDGFMLVFPSAHDALEFSRSAQHAVAEGFRDIPVFIRIGINAGQAVSREGDFYGRTVNLAARVASQASGGETLVSEIVTSLVAGSDDFRFDRPRLVELKGLTGVHYLFSLLDGALVERSL